VFQVLWTRSISTLSIIGWKNYNVKGIYFIVTIGASFTLVINDLAMLI